MTPKVTISKTYDDLLKKINDFLNLDFQNVLDKEIESRLYEIINTVSNPVLIVELPANESYCRIRNDYNYLDDNKFDIKEILGNPKAPLARMNIENERGLYLSNKIEPAMLECDVNENDIFTTAIFTPKEPMSVIVTSVTGKYYNDTTQTNKISELISKFIFECLTMPSDKTKDTYRITNSLLKILYKAFKADGLLYYSSKKKDDYNLFINNESVYKLNVDYIFTCKKEKKLKIIEANKVINNNKITAITCNNIKDIYNK